MKRDGQRAGARTAADKASPAWESVPPKPGAPNSVPGGSSEVGPLRSGFVPKSRLGRPHISWRVQILWSCAAAAALALLAVEPQRIIQGGYLNHVSGVWATLADDVAHGVVYRPLVSDLGYGGTRYFPLYFTLHG